MTEDRGAPVVDRYEDLIRQGIYSGSFVHGSLERDLVVSALRPIVRARRGSRLRILDCGCGPGAWLEEVGRLVVDEGEPAVLFGFDITPSMVEIAEHRLAGGPLAFQVKVGNVLDPASYRFGDDHAHEVVFTFDVIQQLPKRVQFEAVEAMLQAVAPGGSLVVFDHDRRSAYGRKMGLKKWLTRHTPLALLPGYYVESAYPPLSRFADRLRRRPGLAVEMRSVEGSPKRAMVVTPGARTA